MRRAYLLKASNQWGIQKLAWPPELYNKGMRRGGVLATHHTHTYNTHTHTRTNILPCDTIKVSWKQGQLLSLCSDTAVNMFLCVVRNAASCCVLVSWGDINTKPKRTGYRNKMFDIYTHHNIPKCKTQLPRHWRLQHDYCNNLFWFSDSTDIMHNISSLLNMNTRFV